MRIGSYLALAIFGLYFAFLLGVRYEARDLRLRAWKLNECLPGQTVIAGGGQMYACIGGFSWRANAKN